MELGSSGILVKGIRTLIKDIPDSSLSRVLFCHVRTQQKKLFIYDPESGLSPDTISAGALISQPPEL